MLRARAVSSKRLCKSDLRSCRHRAAAIGECRGRDRSALIDTGKTRTAALERELMLAEINPLSSVLTVAPPRRQIVVDLNAVIGSRTWRPDRWRRYLPRRHTQARDGFDYVEVDPQGDRLVTTGAGLFTMLIDEMTTRGGKPLNFWIFDFCGTTHRLVKTLGWIAERRMCGWSGQHLAGITDLAEFANLPARWRTPRSKCRWSRASLAIGLRRRKRSSEKRPDIAVEEDLGAALNRVDAILQGRAP